MGIEHIQESAIGSWSLPTHNGSLLLATLIYGTLNSDVTVTSVTDSANTYTQIGTIQYTDATYVAATGNFTVWQIGLYYCPNALPATGSLTVATSPSPTVSKVFLHEYFGVASLDTYASAATSQSAAPFTSPTLTITPADSGELIYLVADTTGVPSGFTSLQSSGSLSTQGGGHPYSDTFADSHILSCASGTTTLTTANVSIAAAFRPQDYFSPRWVSI